MTDAVGIAILVVGFAVVMLLTWRTARALKPWGEDQPCEHGARHPSVCGECRLGEKAK